ncbi:unnamed protein product [Nesidiocoris tenuis]|uniref:Ig-like domain-containing protein n=1 Tax=Nesidiocoris tenuis TaxID=355587 RepID=A0A6H5GHJ6_9HEMI|nr:unnamed protein product [Nesidiocoris tenuis]
MFTSARPITLFNRISDHSQYFRYTFTFRVEIFVFPCKIRSIDSPTCKHDRVVVVGASRAESLDIPCQVDADPPARSFRWKFNNSGETLDVGLERFSSNGTYSVLRYTPVADLDYGTLSCWAENNIAMQSVPCLFQVVAAGKPYPVRNCSVGNETSSSVVVWCLPGSDGGLPQIFLLEIYVGGSRTPRVNFTATDAPYFYLTDLEVDVSIRLIVYAVNSKGRSSPVVLDDITLRDPQKRTGESFSYVPMTPHAYPGLPCFVIHFFTRYLCHRGSI